MVIKHIRKPPSQFLADVVILSFYLYVGTAPFERRQRVSKLREAVIFDHVGRQSVGAAIARVSLEVGGVDADVRGHTRDERPVFVFDDFRSLALDAHVR